MSQIFYREREIAEASAWLARLHSSDLSAPDETEFHAWLGSNPAHAATFEYVTSIWDQLGSIPRDKFVPQKASPQLDRRTVLAGVAGAGIVLFGSIPPFAQGGAEAEVYYTRVGEQKHLTLPGGTKLLLDTNTLISTTYSSDFCLVRLQRGRINCRITPSDRQFAFSAANHVTVGDDATFDLSFIENYFSVVFIQGHGIISAATGTVELDQGERAMALTSQPLKYDRPALSSLTSWQTGHLMFWNEPLDNAVREMNRYSKTKIEIDDSRVASQKISGGFLAGDNVSFADNLARLYPIKVRRLDNTIHLVDDRAI